MADLSNSPAGKRPKRFALELPLEFRTHNGDRWWVATSEDVSANGIRFRARKSLPPQTPLDVKLQLPAALTGDGTVRLRCSGYVVRSREPERPSDEAQMAVTFVDFHLADGKAGSTAELRQAQNLATRGDVAKLLHRLNTLLFVILGNAELVSLDPGNESSVRILASRTVQAAGEASATVRSLAAALK